MHRPALPALLFLSLATSAGGAAAQGVQVFELEYGWVPFTAFRGEAGPERVRLENVQLTLSAPVVLSKDRAYLLNKLSYERLDLSYENVDPRSAASTIARAHTAKYELTFSDQFRRRWRLTAIGSLQLASDFQSIRISDLQAAGASVLTRDLSDNFVVGGGVGVINASGEPHLVPVVYFRRTSGRLRFELIFPDSATFTVSLGGGIQLGMKAHYSGDSFHLEHGQRAHASVITVGATTRWRFVPALSLSLEAGAALDRGFEGFIDAARDDLPDHLRTGFYLKSSVAVWVGGAGEAP